jgi:hypothetical protein
MKMSDLEPVDGAESYLIEEAEALDALRAHLSVSASNADWSDDPQTVARSLLSQLAINRSADVVVATLRSA